MASHLPEDGENNPTNPNPRVPLNNENGDSAVDPPPPTVSIIHERRPATRQLDYSSSSSPPGVENPTTAWSPAHPPPSHMSGVGLGLPRIRPPQPPPPVGGLPAFNVDTDRRGPAYSTDPRDDKDHCSALATRIKASLPRNGHHDLGPAFGNTVSTPMDIIMTLGTLLPTRLYAREMWSKTGMVHMQSVAVRLLADNKEKKLDFVHVCTTAITVINRRRFAEGYSALENSDSNVLGPALQFVVLYAAMHSPLSLCRDRATQAARAWLQATEAELPNVMALSLKGQAGMKFDLHAPTDVRRLPGHRRLDPNISTFDDDGVIRNQQYGGAWAQILQCVAQNVTFTAPSATEASDILSEILVPAEDPPGSPLHPLRMASGEPYPDFVARFTQKVALCINSLDMLGVKAERAPRQHELCVSFTNAITNALKHKLRHAESLLPPTERLQKDSQDMDYILSLVASASHFEETKSSLLADPPKSGKPSPDPRSKYTGAKHSDSNTEYKRSDFGKRDTGQQRKRDSSRSVSMPAVQMAPDEPDIQLPKAARDEYARLGKTEYQQKQRDDRKCLNCGDTGTINGQKVPTHRARDCPYQRADGEPKHHRGDRLIPAPPSTALPATRSRRNKRDPSPTTAEVNVPAGVSDGPGETDEFPVSMVATTRHVEGQGPNTFAHLSLVAMTPSLPTEGTPPDPGHTCDKRGHDAQDLDAEKLDAQAFFKSHGGIPSRDSAISRQDRAAQRKTPLSWCTATTVLSPGQFAGRQEDNDGRQETPPPMPPPSPELASVAAPKSDTLPPLTLAMPENNPNVSGLFPPAQDTPEASSGEASPRKTQLLHETAATTQSHRRPPRPTPPRSPRPEWRRSSRFLPPTQPSLHSPRVVRPQMRPARGWRPSLTPS